MEAENAIEDAKELLRRREQPSPQEARRVDAALRKAGLSDIDPFWVRWGAFVEQLEGRG